jgi:hypothetical protein
MSSKPKPMWITDDVAWRRVGFNRRRLAFMMIFGTLAAPAGFAAVAYGAKPEFYYLGFMTLAVLPAMVALLGFLFLLQGTYFCYDCQGFALQGINPWGTNIIRRWRSKGIHPWHPEKETSYPERGFDRLEFSVANASVNQVRPDGGRERLWMRPGWADPTDWDAFIAHLRRIGALEHSG